MTANQPKISQYGRYEILSELGRGAMGVVYRAHDPQIDRLIALKVLREDRVTSNDLVQRFVKEAKAIGRLSHPGIVTVYDVGQDHGTIFIAMEFLEGTPLNEVIQSKTLTVEESVDLGIQVADALDYAHSHGIVHRDIKSTNIILGPSGRAKITDFGIAHVEDPSATQQTQAGEILGTPVYMSPEQVMSKPVDGRSDLYSLGIILYELTTGHRPFRGDNLASIFRAITQDTPDPPATAAPGTPKPLSDTIVKSLSKDPEGRFQTGKAMAEALRSSLVVEPPARAPEKATKSKPGVVILSLVVIVVLSITGLIYFKREPKSGQTPAIPQGRETRDTATAGQALKSAILAVSSTPDGAQVFVDNEFKGKSPLHLDLPLGKHDVRLSLPDYYEWEAQVRLQDEGKTPLSVRLVPIEDQAS